MDEYTGSVREKIEEHMLEGERLVNEEGKVEEAQKHFHRALILAGYYDED